MDRGTVVMLRREIGDIDLEFRARSIPLSYRRRLRDLVEHLRWTQEVMALRAAFVADAGTPSSGCEVWPAYSDSAGELSALLNRIGLVVPTDWRTWALEAAERWERAPLDLSVPEAVKYVTVVVRSDRTVEGRYARSIIDGSLLHALEVVLDRT